MSILIVCLVGVTCFLIGGATVIVVAATMRSSQISRDEKQAVAPVAWWERIRSRFT
jgi:hypothetical protein